MDDADQSASIGGVLGTPAMQMRSFSTLFALALALAACSSDPAPDGKKPSVIPTDQGHFGLHLTPSPDPFVSGDNSLDLELSDSGGAMVSGGHVAIEPWMPAMGHGVSVVPDVTELGAGAYHAEHVTFSMPGQWELRFTINAAGVEDHATVPYDVH